MIFCITNVLTPQELEFAVSSLNQADFVDGKLTAGWQVRQVKDNTQLKNDAPYSKDLRELVHNALWRNAAFQMTVYPKAIHSTLFSRYEPGMSYGRHIDNPLMLAPNWVRSDVSLTLFLNSPADYEGGELVVESSQGEKIFKQEASSMVVYPSSTLHRVEPVRQGVRIVTVSWVQSLVRDPSEREILYDLDRARRAIFEEQGKTPASDLIAKSHANLLRKWAEP